MEPLPPDLQLGNHTLEEVNGWMRRLRYFSFMGAISEDHYSRDEELALYLRFDGHDDLVMMLDQLGILAYGDGTPPSPIATPGPRNIATFPDLVNPGDCTVAGVPCNVEVLSSSLIISVKEGDSGVTGQRVADAQTIESRLDELGFAVRTIPLNWGYKIQTDRAAS